MVALTHLPDETLELVIECMAFEDRKSFSLVSRRMNAIAVRLSMSRRVPGPGSP